MNILFLTQHYWPGFGGVETYVRNLAGALIELGHQVTVVTGATADDQVECEEYDGVRIHRYPATRSKIRCRAWFVKNALLFRSAEVIHVSNTLMVEYLRDMLGPFINWSRVFLTRHGMSGQFPVPDSERTRARRSQKWVAGVVHDGRFIERWLDVKPDLCPEQGLFPVADEIAPVQEPPPHSAIFIGRLEPDTGITDYIESTRLINEKLATPFSLHVYGQGSLKAHLLHRAEQLRAPVVFHEPTPDARERIAEHCFAFVDGRMAIHEAFARRRAVIAVYRNPWKRDYLCGETFSPYLVAVDSPEAHARRVVELATCPMERLSLSANAFEYARTLNWRRTAEAFLELWQSRLRHTRPAGAGPGARKRHDVTRAQPVLSKRA